ncbi:MAG: hypothetical protein R3D88_00110 [Alphaproteobacteria bacterium]|nr:hypothetical protein [Alphaproteobacteria bacterium]
MRKLIWLTFLIAPVLSWFYAVMERLGVEDWIMLAIDVLIPPAGVIDGIGLYMGWW